MMTPILIYDIDAHTQTYQFLYYTILLSASSVFAFHLVVYLVICIQSSKGICTSSEIGLNTCTCYDKFYFRFSIKVNY